MQKPERTKKKSLSTRRGDAGETDLLFGQRVSKSHPQVEACGTLDELSAALAMAKATCASPAHARQFGEIQTDLIALMGEISTPADRLDRYRASKFPQLDETSLARIDGAVEALEEHGPAPAGWALPGKNLHEASLEVARATARRSERRLVALQESGYPVRPLLLQYVNRISDLLWLLAREAE